MLSLPRRCLLVALVYSFAFLSAAPAAEAERSLAYRTPQGVTMEITADGLSAIRVGDRVAASGKWSVFNAEGWFKDSGSEKAKTDPIKEKSLEILGPNHARVRQSGGDVTCIADYTFAGEDVTISARVENNHADEPINVVGFSGLTFHFDSLPDGLMPVQHISYFRAHGLGLCHPSHWSRIGGSYATDKSLGVGLSPWRTGLARTLILWDYADWNPDKREKLPERRLIYFVGQAVPARGARTFDFVMRVSPNHDWKHLLSPYREHFQQTFGPVRYKADYRWIATDYLNHSVGAISPENPYGFHGGARRIDRKEGLDAFCQALIPALKSGNGQGVIVWGQGGEEPRGGMYRPDFDILPPEVAANWPTLAARFREAGLKLGVTTRPADMALRLDWKSDQIITLNADDPGHREMLWRRFKNMIDGGCTLFYLDSFGADLEHVKLMRWLRERMGENVLTLVEHQCDAIMPYSGGYSETSFNKVQEGREAGFGLWSGLNTWEIYQWLVPGCQMASRLYQGEKDIPQGFESSERFFLRNRISPLMPVSNSARWDSVRMEQPKFLGPDGQWK